MSEPFNTTCIKIDRSPEIEAEKQDKEKEKAEKQKAIEIAKSQLPTEFQEKVKDLQSLEFYSNVAKEQKAQAQQTKANSASGVVSLESQYRKEPTRKGGFSDYAEMVSSLKRDERNGSTESRDILNALWVKSFANVDKPEHFELEGNLSDLVSGNGKARFVQKRSLPDNDQENQELKA
jgi:hypothetical protein